MRYLFPILAVLILAFTGCPPVSELEAPKNVTSTVLTNGDGLKIEWDEVTDAQGYYIYVDGSKVDSTTSGTDNDINVTTPGKSITVTAFKGNDESAESDAINTEAVLTSSIVVYGMSDPNQYVCAFGFNTAGTCLGLDVSVPGNSSAIDYVIEDRGVPMAFWSPHHFNPPYNNEANAASLAATTDFSALELAAAAGNYNTKTDISVNGVYSLWVDPTGAGWSVDDNYAKVRVEGVSGTQVTLKAAYQPIGGLRWLVAD